ncbi:hypothetical protein [Streptomyces sp. NPDC054838]
MQASADAFEQAARAPGARSLEGRARAGWRASIRALEHAPRAARGGGAAVVLTLLIALVEAVEAAVSWHRAQAFRAQAKAAAEAAILLREAAGLTGTPPPTTQRVPVGWCAPRAVACRPPHPLPVYRSGRARIPDGQARPVRADLGRGSFLPMTYPPQPEPFSEALGEATQSTAMAYRLG